MGNKATGAADSKSAASSSDAKDDRPKKASKWVLGKTDPLEKHYKIEAPIGQPGQYGSAAIVVHRTTGERRAVKIIKKHSFNPEHFDLFRTEIEIMDKLNHPNIIKGYEVFETVAELYIVMELCSGGELFDRIKAKTRYSEVDAVKVIKQLFGAIAYFHEHKVAHCDLKPDNFLFLTKDEDSVIKVIDFGMSKHVKRREYLRRLAGTPFYIAPEVLRGSYTEACDMWSMGVIIFIMVFGFPPFHAANDDLIHESIKKGFNPVTKDGYGPWFPSAFPASDSVKDIIKKLLTLDTATRMTAKEALEHPWVSGETASDKPLVKNVLQGLANFTANNKLKTAMLGHLSNSLSDAELTELKKNFAAIDKNKDGFLSIEELQEALKNNLGDAKSLTTLLTNADLDKDGKLSYEELMSAAVQKKLVAKEERLWNAFCELDKDGNGKVSKEEIESVFKGTHSTKDIKAMIKEADADGDGQIDYDEFIKVWMKE